MEKTKRTLKSWKWLSAAAALILPVFFVFFALAGVPAAAHAATSSASFVFTPASVAVQSGQQFTVAMVVNASAAVNAAQGTVTFPIDQLQVVSISKDNSIFPFWSTDPTFSNSAGTVDFGGGVPSPGFTGTNGLLFSITFRATGSGAATLNVTQGAILANDGQGTNILTSIVQGVYTIGSGPVVTAPTQIANNITSQAYPNSTLWYNAATADFEWVLTPGADRVAYVFDQAPDGTPSQNSDGSAPVGQISYPLASVADGVWYLHLQLRTNGVWSMSITKKIQIDRTPPTIGAIHESTQDPTDPTPTFTWSGSDDLSGIQGYRVTVDSGNAITPTPQTAAQITLPAQAPGKHTLTIEARDNAGNHTSSVTTFVVQPIAMPAITSYPHTLSQSSTPGVVNQPIVVAGTAPTGTVSVNVYLRNGSNTLSFNAPVTASSSWQVTYAGSLSSGTWQLTAQAVDARGAMSEETLPMLIQANSTVGSFIRFFASWGSFALVVLLLGTLIGLLIVEGSGRVKRRRLKLKSELMTAQANILRDMERLQEDLESQRATAARRKLEADVKDLTQDLEKGLKEVKKDL